MNPDEWIAAQKAKGFTFNEPVRQSSPAEATAVDKVSTAKKKKRSEDARVSGEPSWSFTLSPACRVFPEANRRVHWAVRAKRGKHQREAVWDSIVTLFLGFDWASFTDRLPLDVTFIHIGRRMDDDNLRSAFKAIRDYVAKWIGVDDGDSRVTWMYDQCPGKPGCQIIITPSKR